MNICKNQKMKMIQKKEIKNTMKSIIYIIQPHLKLKISLYEKFNTNSNNVIKINDKEEKEFKKGDENQNKNDIIEKINLEENKFNNIIEKYNNQTKNEKEIKES